MNNELAQQLNLSVEWIDSTINDAPVIDATDRLSSVVHEVISRAQISEFGVKTKPSAYEIKLVTAGYISGNYRGREEARDTLQNILEMAAYEAANQHKK